MKLQHLAPVFVICVAAVAQPGVQAPSDHPALLARDASQRHRDWTQKGLVRGIQSQSPQKLLAEISQAEGLMRAYMEAESRLYGSLVQATEQDIANFTEMGRMKWGTYLQERADSLGRTINALFDEEERLKLEIQSLMTDTRPEVVSYRRSIVEQLDRARKVKDELENQRSRFENAARQDTDKARQDLLVALGKQKANYKDLLKNAHDSEAELVGFYSDLRTYGERRAAAEAAASQQRPVASAPPPENAGGAPPVSVVVPTTPVPASPPASGTVWSFKRAPKAKGWPAQVQFQITEQHGANLKGVFSVWGDVGASPEVALPCAGSIKDNSITCTAVEGSLVVVMKANRQISEAIPSSLTLKAEWHPKGGATLAQKLEGVSITQ